MHQFLIIAHQVLLIAICCIVAIAAQGMILGGLWFLAVWLRLIGPGHR